MSEEEEDWSATLEELGATEPGNVWADALERMTGAPETARRQYAWPLHHAHGRAIVTARSGEATAKLNRYREISAKFQSHGYRAPPAAQEKKLLKEWEALAKEQMRALAELQNGVDEIYEAALPPIAEGPLTPSERKLAAMLQEAHETGQREPEAIVELLKKHGITEKDLFD